LTETQAQPGDDEMRAAYEAELNRITSTEMILQTVVSLVNIGGRRLGLVGGPDAPRDLDQVTDAIDGARALIPILERRMAHEVGPLRDAIAQLQMAYAREARAKPPEKPGAKPPEKPPEKTGEEPSEKPPEKTGEEPSEKPPEKTGEEPPEKPSEKTGEEPSDTSATEAAKGPGPAESSGRLWVPGR